MDRKNNLLSFDIKTHIFKNSFTMIVENEKEVEIINISWGRN